MFLQALAQRKRQERYPMKWFHAALIAGVIGIPGAGIAQATKPAPAQPVQSATPPPVAAPPAEASKPVDSSAPATPPVTGVQAGAADASGKDAAHYIIGPEDTLQVTVWKEPTLSGTFPVRPDGMISLVLVGDLPAAGRTPMQLSDEISTKLKKYLQDPSVTVLVMAVNSQRIYMIGEVGHVGPIALAADMSPLKAIATAGGLSPFANSKKIYILRGEAGKQQKIPFNYKRALKGDSTQDIKLQPGDTIVVP
jgi:polysaccharide biosynthesis/export protein